jgi:uncharacterized membrane protein
MDPVMGEQRGLPRFESRNGCAPVPLKFEPNGSMLVVFTKSSLKTEAGSRNHIRKQKHLARKEAIRRM